MFDNTDIIITSSTNKKELLKSFNNSLKNIKIYTLSEFNRLFYYDYDTNANLYIMNNYKVNNHNVIYELSDIYLKNLTYINNQTYTSPKLQFLSKLKQELLDNKLLKINKLFRKSLENKNIVIYNLGDTKEIQKLKEELSLSSKVEIINEHELKYKNHDVYKLGTMEEEVAFVANDICEHIANGVDIKNIYLTNLTDDYYRIIRRVFTMFNIPFTLKDNGSIYGTFLVNKFLELYSNDMNKTMEGLKEYIDSEESEEIYNQILSVVNKYAFINNYLDVLPLIKHDLKKTKIKRKDIVNSVHEVSLDSSFTDDDYVYLLSFNQGVIPHIHKDEQYLTDKDKEELNLSLTYEKNNQEKEDTINTLSNIKNLIITYKTITGEDKAYISNLFEELNYTEKENPYHYYSYSNSYNKVLLTDLKDEYNKYGSTSDALFTLSTTYKDLPYKIYNHDYSGIKPDDLHKFLNNKLTLAYTTMDKYYKCPFSYYINNILKLNIFEDSFESKFGTLFHAILENYDPNSSFDNLWKQEKNKIEEGLNSQEQFFLDMLKDEVEFAAKVIKEQENYTELHDELHEEKVYVSLSGAMKITIMGSIDKIKYKKEKDRTILAIIDYKTNESTIDLSTIPYGIGMQLPVYIYLAHNHPELKNVVIAGIYLQHILYKDKKTAPGADAEDLRRKYMRLNGYSIDDRSILSILDKTYEDSQYIQKMRITKENEFYKHADILSKEQFAILEKIAEEKINESVNNISNANFPIAPKEINGDNYGCEYCKYKDICFHTPKDTVRLDPVSEEDLFGGDE